jgi:signal transduction histidine kinase
LLSKWPIRLKFLTGLGLLLLLMSILFGSGLYATYAYRSLVRTLSQRAEELPLAAELRGRVSELRMTISELRGLLARAFPEPSIDDVPLRVRLVRDKYQTELAGVQEAFSRYRLQLEYNVSDGSPSADFQQEQAALREMEGVLQRVRRSNSDVGWMLDTVRIEQLSDDLEDMQSLSAKLPRHLHDKIRGFRDEVRNRYRTLIVGTWIVAITAVLIVLLLVKLFYQWVFHPLRVLIGGSRMVAAGHFGYRIHLDAHDEMAELAAAMNDMTARFQAIRDDLDRQVQERTKQVVRSEQLASVGFLAAGVAHEINNPLASIALCAESLESRLAEVLDPKNPDQAVFANYLQMIQTEAFRCKGITEKLLDFSRVGQVKRQNTDLAELVQGVIDMLLHMGRYQKKPIELVVAQPVIVPVNPQEIKQVVLNLLTNALDCIDDSGKVKICLDRRDGFAELAVIDNGYGMTPDVLEHVFEPFFTRRRSGQGTGLGLSISYRIVADHGGTIEAQSAGAGQGATFRVRLPLTETEKEVRHHYQAA